MNNISVNIIARDAAKDLPRCLKSISGLSDDIVVVIDDRTTDDSKEICKKFKARTFIRTFDDFSSQKNFALLQSAHDWVLLIDADEEISPSLAEEIKYCITSLKYSAYSIPRLNIIFNKPIYHSNWGPKDDSHVWLFRKSQAFWSGKVHEEIVTQGDIGLLKNPKIHHSYTSVSEFITKINLYTSLETKNTFSYKQIFWLPLRDFLRRYFWHAGFLDGWHGFYLCYLMIIYHLSIAVKTWQKHHVSS